MRRAIWCGILVTLFMLGCRQQAAQSTAKDQSGPSDVAKPDADRPAPSKEMNTGATAEKLAAGPREVVELDAITLTAPAGWERKPAGSSFVAAEFSLPRVEGDDADGRLTIRYCRRQRSGEHRSLEKSIRATANSSITGGNRRRRFEDYDRQTIRRIQRPTRSVCAGSEASQLPYDCRGDPNQRPASFHQGDRSGKNDRGAR